MTTTPFRQIVRCVPLRGGGKAHAEVSRHNHSRILAFCSSCETIPERPFWADSVPVGVRRRILHRCHLAPAMYCRHQHSCGSTIPFTRRQILTSHSVHLPVLPCTSTRRWQTSSRPKPAYAEVSSLGMRQFAIRRCTSRPCASQRTLRSFGCYWRENTEDSKTLGDGGADEYHPRNSLSRRSSM